MRGIYGVHRAQESTRPAPVVGAWQSIVGADDPNAPKKIPLWKIGIGAVVVYGVAYVVMRPSMKRFERDTKELHATLRENARKVGIKPGMSDAEQDAAWDAHYAKSGLKLNKDGDLVKV